MGTIKNLNMGSMNPVNIIKCIKYNRDYKKLHPLEFGASGISVYCGKQGSGKTLSAVNYCKNLLDIYPNCKFVTNTIVNGLNDDIEVIPYSTETLWSVNNDEFGVLYLIDEMHLEFNSLNSKNIPDSIFTEVAQQRKQRKHIVGTSQVFERLAKPFREQIDTFYMCHTFLKYIQILDVYDGSSISSLDGQVSKDMAIDKLIFFHSPSMYLSYDTYFKIKGVNND